MTSGNSEVAYFLVVRKTLSSRADGFPKSLSEKQFFLAEQDFGQTFCSRFFSPAKL